ncbi:hypothetical protein RRG08_053145 [Elysia crispata]|uniref:Uncharacterized protein n=1 Tax=Elysia crispata TaxID=231223 RepID=A0AAE1A907_9GAST|nr:hypothetical protein RRG08_053145 [Elysia crispata]
MRFSLNECDSWPIHSSQVLEPHSNVSKVASGLDANTTRQPIRTGGLLENTQPFTNTYTHRAAQTHSHTMCETFAIHIQLHKLCPNLSQFMSLDDPNVSSPHHHPRSNPGADRPFRTSGLIPGNVDSILTGFSLWGELESSSLHNVHSLFLKKLTGA